MSYVNWLFLPYYYAAKHEKMKFWNNRCIIMATHRRLQYCYCTGTTYSDTDLG